MVVAQDVGGVHLRLLLGHDSRSKQITVTAAGRTWKGCWSTADR